MTEGLHRCERDALSPTRLGWMVPGAAASPGALPADTFGVGAAGVAVVVVRRENTLRR